MFTDTLPAPKLLPKGDGSHLVSAQAKTEVGRQVLRAQAGDQDALRAVLRRVAPDVLAASRSVLGATSEAGKDAEDVVQDTLLKITKVLDTLRDPDAIIAFARRTAIRRALRARERRVSERGRLSLFKSQEEIGGPRGLPVPRRIPTSADDLLEMLEALPEAQAQTMTMRYILGYSLVETAEAMECPVNTVRSRVRLAREALRDMIAATPVLIPEEFLDPPGGDL